MASALLGADFGSESEDENFNPAPADDSDNDGAGESEAEDTVKPKSSDVLAPRRQVQEDGYDEDEEDKRNTRPIKDNGQPSNGHDAENGEDDDEEDEEDEDEEDAVTVCSCNTLLSTRSLMYKRVDRASELVEIHEISSLMSKPRSMTKTRETTRTMKEMRLVLLQENTQMMIQTSLLVLKPMIEGIGNSTVNASAHNKWMQRNKHNF